MSILKKQGSSWSWYQESNIISTDKIFFILGGARAAISILEKREEKLSEKLHKILEILELLEINSRKSRATAVKTWR